MKPQSPSSQSHLMDRLQGLLKASAGGLVIASATIATVPSTAKA